MADAGTPGSGSPDTTRSDPVAALERVAFLLEATQAPTYRVRGFRTAAEVVTATGPARIAQLVAAGRLTDLRGIGPTTATVITETLAGGEGSSYLAELEETAGDIEAEDPAVTELLGALRGDAHTHTDWSDGGSPLAVMAAAAGELGHEWLAVTDHSPRLTIAHGLSSDRLRAQLTAIAELNDAVPVRVLTGIEVDILEDGTLDAEPELLDRLDVVVASVHSKLRMEATAMTARMIAAVCNPRVDILGHCTGRIVVGKGRPPSTFDGPAVFAACACSGTVVEINSRPERLDPPDELLAAAVDAGCLVSIDTDAHAPGQLSWQANGARKAVKANVGPDRILTAWSAAALVAWTHRADD